jgi:hypothetical protein
MQEQYEEKNTPSFLFSDPKRNPYVCISWLQSAACKNCYPAERATTARNAMFQQGGTTLA